MNASETAYDAESTEVEWPFSLEPISPAIGVEVGGLDLREQLGDETITALRRALVKHKVLVFRDQDITPAQQVALARRKLCRRNYPKVVTQTANSGTTT